MQLPLPDLEFTELFPFILSLIFGILIGLEREHAKDGKQDVRAAGTRTYAAFCLAGTISAYIAGPSDSGPNFIWFLAIGFIGLIAMLVTSYILVAKREPDEKFHTGMTSEIASVLTYLIGVITFYDATLAIVLTILVLILLSSKGFFKQKFLPRVEDSDIHATLKFLFITFIILPILPNEQFGPYNAFNLQKFWLLVVLIAFISYFGYIINKLISADKGILITGFLGGLISSTATTLSFSRRSKEVPDAFDKT